MDGIRPTRAGLRAQASGRDVLIARRGTFLTLHRDGARGRRRRFRGTLRRCTTPTSTPCCLLVAAGRRDRAAPGTARSACVQPRPLAAGPAVWRDVDLDERRSRRCDARHGSLATDDRLAAATRPPSARLARSRLSTAAAARPNPPLALFVAGDLARLWHPASPWSAAVARRRAGATTRAPSPAPWPARLGRDQRARGRHRHRRARSRAGGPDGPTVAVLGTGPDVRLSARQRRAAWRRIAATARWSANTCPGTGPRPEHFPSRNRILAGPGAGHRWWSRPRSAPAP